MKKIFITLMSIFLSLNIFAQNVESVGIKDADVKNWAKNIETIEEDLEEADIDAEELFKLPAKKISAFSKVLNKRGISGENSVQKFLVITQSAAVLYAESKMDQASKDVLLALGMDPLGSIKSYINLDDFAVVQANSKLVIKAYAKISDDYDDDYNEYSDFYDDDDDDYDDDDEDDEYENYLKGLNKAKGDLFSSVVKKNHEDSAVKKYYDGLLKSKGDSGFIYKKKSNMDAAGYKEKKNSSTKLIFKIEDDLEDAEIKANPVCDVDDEINGVVLNIDLKKNLLKMDFVWTEYEYDEDSPNGIDMDYEKESLKYSIKSFKCYENYDEDSGNGAKEYVISTKEGPVLHFWKYESFDGNEYTAECTFAGFNNSESLNWYTWSDD